MQIQAGAVSGGRAWEVGEGAGAGAGVAAGPSFLMSSRNVFFSLPLSLSLFFFPKRASLCTYSSCAARHKHWRLQTGMPLNNGG